MRVCPGDIALVSTRDRYRVVVEQTGEILAELVRLHKARAIVRTFDDDTPGRTAIIEAYSPASCPTQARSQTPYRRFVEGGAA